MGVGGRREFPEFRKVSIDSKKVGAGVARVRFNFIVEVVLVFPGKFSRSKI